MKRDRTVRVAFRGLCCCLAMCSCVHPSKSPPASRTGTVAEVYIFVNNDCPIANRYSPEIRRLHQLYSRKGAAFWLVHCDPDETQASVMEHDRHYGLSLPVIMDPDGSLARRCRAEIIPSAAVFSASGELVYHGRIDYRFQQIGRERPQRSHYDLAEALDAVLAHRPVLVPQTQAVGCYIFNGA